MSPLGNAETPGRPGKMRMIRSSDKQTERTEVWIALHLPRSGVPPVGDTSTFTPCASVIGQRATGAAGGGLRMRAHGLARGKCTFSALSNGTGRPVTGPRSPFLPALLSSCYNRRRCEIPPLSREMKGS